MPHDYPVHLSLKGRVVLAVGAGEVARRRVPRLVKCGARVRVVAPEAEPEIQRMAGAGELQWLRRGFANADLEGASVVFIASNDRPLNARVAKLARAQGAWVNRADAPEDSDFAVPAQAHGEHCSLSISTGGRAPAASRRLAQELSGWLAKGPERFVNVMAEARTHLLQRLPRAEARTKLRTLAAGPLWDACARRDEDAIRETLARSLGAEAP